MERRSSVLLGENEEKFFVECLARLELRCRGEKTDPVPKETVDFICKTAMKKDKRDEETNQTIPESGEEVAPQGLAPEVPQQTEPFPDYPLRLYQMHQEQHRYPYLDPFGLQPPPGFKCLPYHNQLGELPSTYGPRPPLRVPHYTELPMAPDFNQPPPYGQPAPHCPHYTDLPLAGVFPHQCVRHPDPMPAFPSSNPVDYVEIDREFRRVVEQAQAQSHEGIPFDEELFLAVAEQTAPPPPGFMWTTLGLIRYSD